MPTRDCDNCTTPVSEELLHTIKLRSADGQINETLRVCDYCFHSTVSMLIVDNIERLESWRDDVPELR